MKKYQKNDCLCKYSKVCSYHFKDDSLVKIWPYGNEVKIAKCGNSGNTSEPHVHFQLQNGMSFFLSSGLPIAFSNISVQAKVNYELADLRLCANNLQTVDNKIYIGRGLEVENTNVQVFRKML